MKFLRWSAITGFTAAAGYFLQKGEWEIALTSIIIPVLAGFAPLLFQKDAPQEKKQKSWLQSLIKNNDFKKQYFNLLMYQHRDFDIKGLSTQTKYTLELDQVFIELKFQPQVAHKATSDPLQIIPLKFRKDSYPIWRFFTLLSDEKALNPKMVIVGPPGSGKTTLLKYMTLFLAASHNKHEQKKVKIRKIPAILFLRDHINDIVENPAIMLPKIIENNVVKWDVSLANNWFSERLKNGECLILLDGLDEVADSKARRKIVSWIEKQFQAYPKNAFIITSRPHGYKENPISGVTVLEVMPFSRSQIDSFVQKWYLANEVKSHNVDDPGVRMTAKSGADDLLRRLEKTQNLMELAVNPLLLTMIATVHRYRSALPGRRVELYKEIYEVFLGKRQESKGLSIDMVPAQKQNVLQSLAYEMMREKIREIRKPDAVEIIKPSLSMVAPNLNPEVFLQSIEQQTGLVLERELGIYSFTHKTFQEYLASMYILDKNLESELYERIKDDWWHEVIKLYAAQTDATQLIRTCLDQDPPSSVALSLAIQCLEEAQRVQPELRDIAERILMENAEDEDPEIRTIVGQALLSNRLKHLSALSPSIFIDTKLVTNAEYQIFIDDMLFRGGGDFYPMHWKQKSFPIGKAHAPATGLTPWDVLEFCQWLTALHAGSGEWRFRLPIRSEIDSEKYSDVSGFWVLQNNSKDLIVEIWKNPSIANIETPTSFIQRIARDDIKALISSINHETILIESLENSTLGKLTNAFKKLVRASSKPDTLLVETANALYSSVIGAQTSRPVDFGYGQINLEAYDQTLSDSIEVMKNHDFEACVINSVGCFSDFIRTNIRSSSRFEPLFLAFVFEFFIKWMGKNKSLFSRIKVDSILRKIDYLVDQYIDCLIILGRTNNVTLPFEGLILVKEVKEEI